MGQNFTTAIQNIGGTKSSLNLTATGTIKASSGTLFRVFGSTLGTGTLTLNDTNILITAQTVTAITAAANAVVTLSSGGTTNPFAVGNPITFASVVGMTQINALLGTVTAIGGVTTAWTVTTSINSSAFTAYTSGGTAASFGVVNQIIAIPAASLTAGLPQAFECVFNSGLTVTTVPTTSLYTITYS